LAAICELNRLSLRTESPQRTTRRD